MDQVILSIDLESKAEDSEEGGMCTKFLMVLSAKILASLFGLWWMSKECQCLNV